MGRESGGSVGRVYFLSLPIVTLWESPTNGVCRHIETNLVQTEWLAWGGTASSGFLVWPVHRGMKGTLRVPPPPLSWKPGSIPWEEARCDPEAEAGLLCLDRGLNGRWDKAFRLFKSCRAAEFTPPVETRGTTASEMTDFCRWSLRISNQVNKRHYAEPWRAINQHEKFT